MILRCDIRFKSLALQKPDSLIEQSLDSIQIGTPTSDHSSQGGLVACAEHCRYAQILAYEGNQRLHLI